MCRKLSEQELARYFLLSKTFRSVLGSTCVCDLRLPLQLKLNSSELLHSIRWFQTDIAGLPIGPFVKGQAVQAKCLALEVGIDK